MFYWISLTRQAQIWSLLNFRDNTAGVADPSKLQEGYPAFPNLAKTFPALGWKTLRHDEESQSCNIGSVAYLASIGKVICDA